jgi:hypothetical protein
VAIDVCLIFYVAVIFSSKFFRFLFVKLSLLGIGLKIGFKFFLLNKLVFGVPLEMAEGASVRAPIIFKLCFADFFGSVRHQYWRRVHR